MRIAQVAPLIESVPPAGYGGTERVVSYLTEELVRQGHDVTLFASGDSVTAAELVPCCERSLRTDPHCQDRLAHHVRMMERVLERERSFDIIHHHIDYLHFPISRRGATPQVTTTHGRQDIRDLVALYEEYLDMPLISISDAQREPVPWARWIATVHHGLPEDLYTPVERPSLEYLAYIGRISPEKGLERAIEIAQRAGVHFRIAAKVDRVDQDYFVTAIKPLLQLPGVEYIGELAQHEKNEFLGNALALLFQIDWPEPFGLAMIEAMACGTPVITRPRGSVPEVVDAGVTGFVAEQVGDAVRGVEQAAELDRAQCRRAFEQRFSARRMANDYVNAYRQIIHDRPRMPLPARRMALPSSTD